MGMPSCRIGIDWMPRRYIEKPDEDTLHSLLALHPLSSKLTRRRVAHRAEVFLVCVQTHEHYPLVTGRGPGTPTKKASCSVFPALPLDLLAARRAL